LQPVIRYSRVEGYPVHPGAERGAAFELLEVLPQLHHYLLVQVLLGV